jgi:hypothetical protein
LVDFDLFCFEDCTPMLGILASPLVTFQDAGGQLVLNYPDPAPPPNTTCDLGVASGEVGNPSFPTATTFVSIEPVSGVDTIYTIEWRLYFESIPDGTVDTATSHIYLGASDGAGPVAGLFISQDGIAYTGSVHFAGGNLVLDAAIQPIPNTSALIVLGQPTTIRLAVDGVSGSVYLYVTPTNEVLATGHRLIAVLPVIDAGDVAQTPIDQALVSARGTTALPSRVVFDAICMGSTLLVANLPPIASVGLDQAARLCSIVQLDGSASFDPEGAALLYSWRLVNGPRGSSFVVDLNDGITTPLGPPTGFTNHFHSATLGTVHASDPLLAGDVLFVAGESYGIIGTGSDGGGFFVSVSAEAIPDDFTGVPFKVLRQRGISGATTPKPTFFPDALGFYSFALVVNDGDLPSAEAITVVNVVDSPLPRGITPDAGFLFDYLSDFWRLLEDAGPIETTWSAVAQVTATELYTLWQHEYSKSLRDIQRTFVRRWLHYDLLLAEPIPELTTFRLVYGGLRSAPLAAGGTGGITGTHFAVSSAVHASKVVTLVSQNPVKAAQLALEIGNRLREVDARYSATATTRSDGTGIVLINAPFLFTISGSTVPVLSDGVSDLARGSGSAAAARAYRVDRSLDGLGIRENDLLILGDVAYRIAQIASDPSDPEPLQRVVLKSDIPPTGVPSWVISGYVRSELLDFYAGLVTRGDAVFFDVVSDAGATLLRTSALGVSVDDPSSLAFEVTADLAVALADPDVGVSLAKVVRRTHLPLDESIVDIPTLTEVIVLVDDTATLRRNVDYFLEDYRGQPSLSFVTGTPDVWEGGVPPDRLWAEYTYLDNNPTIEANFGVLAGVTLDEIQALPGSVDYLSAIRGIWYAYMNGPTLRNLRVGAQILLGLPFAEEAGTIEEIRTDFSPSQGRLLIRDAAQTEIVRSYTFPRALDLEVNPDTGTSYVIGDSVTQFAPLVEGVEVVDWVKDPTWFVGLLNQGIFTEPQKLHTFLVRVDSAIFGLPALSFTSDFIEKIKPVYTSPLFLVTAKVGDTEISVTDDDDVY